MIKTKIINGETITTRTPRSSETVIFFLILLFYADLRKIRPPSQPFFEKNAKGSPARNPPGTTVKRVNKPTIGMM